MAGNRFLINILVSIDQLINTIFGGKPDETISSRWAKGRESGCWLCKYGCKFLDLIDPDHCSKHIEMDE